MTIQSPTEALRYVSLKERVSSFDVVGCAFVSQVPDILYSFSRVPDVLDACSTVDEVPQYIHIIK